MAVFADLFTDQSTVPIAVGDFDHDGNPDFISGEGSGDGLLLLGTNNYPDVVLQDVENQMTVIGESYVTVNITNPEGFIISQSFQTVAGAAYWRHDVTNDGLLDDETYDYNFQTGEYQIVFEPRPGLEPGDQTFTAGIIIDGTQKRTTFSDYDVPEAGKGKASGSIVFYFDIDTDAQINPDNGRATGTPSPKFAWGGLLGQAATYHFQLHTRHDFDDTAGVMLRDLNDLTDTLYQLDTALEAGSVYYWRVASSNNATWSRSFAAFTTEFICGDINGDGGELIDISDLVYLVEYMFNGGPEPPNLSAADVNGSHAMPIDISDLVYLVDYMFTGGPEPPLCP